MGKFRYYSMWRLVALFTSLLVAGFKADEDLMTVPPQPEVLGSSHEFLEGETFSLNCTVDKQKNTAVMLNWILPNGYDRSTILYDTNNNEKANGKLYYNITIVNATSQDAGTYVCISKNGDKNSTAKFEKKYLEEAYLKLSRDSPKKDPVLTKNTTRISFNIEDYPKSEFTLLKGDTAANKEKYAIVKKNFGGVTILFKNLTLTDTGLYTLIADNKYLTKNFTFDLRVQAPPVMDFGPNTVKKYVKNTKANLKCETMGYPLSSIECFFSNGVKTPIQVTNRQEGIYKIVTFLTIPAHTSGNITCVANNNTKFSARATRSLVVYEMPDGFGIENASDTWFFEKQDVSIKCRASKYDFVNVTWETPEDTKLSVEYGKNSLSYIAELRTHNMSVSDAGDYTCVGVRHDGTEKQQTISIVVAETKLITIDERDANPETSVFRYQPVQLNCMADAVPPPKIIWRKDGELLNDSDVEIFTDHLNHTAVNSTLDIKKMEEKNIGKYECLVTNEITEDSRFYNLVFKNDGSLKYLSYLSGTILALILIVLYLAWRIKKEKQFRKELAAAGLLYFKEGVTKSLNPKLGIDEQAELLPYDEKFEFPPEKLILGKQLGAGAFGVVYKAEARGIINAEETTPVAVKMVKKTADNMYIKALASELKIMVHLGKHVNIVNLLGACTKNVGKRELIIIVEYCKFGNIHNYMQKHREVFIDQLTDNEKNLGKVNRGYSCSSGNSGMHSEYSSSGQVQDTGHTFLNTGNTNRSGRKVSETGYLQPDWRSNYESDYSFDGRSPRPLCSRDLLAWAFQIARGMEYLASRKVLHGDLAARNVLLAEDNVVKICDFGLARSIYNNDEYHKQENSPLPVKWLAIECMEDRIFSTQSDVWSFGIVLWEIFSLAKTPYPNISPRCLLQWLTDGHRLKKPAYADDRLYDVMMKCWQQKPTARPTFSQLQEVLGSFLEDNVRNHYVDLNSSYMDMNVKAEGQADYLEMVCAPDYNNMVTPSPHHYVNDTNRFFPPTSTQLQHDADGYLQMSPAKRNVFISLVPESEDEARASKPTSFGTELTPMLTKNRSGSESDQEFNPSPYFNMCPKIDEESDEVFETKQNMRNAQNISVTNPSYITLDINSDKRTNDFTNNYINIQTANGLVK